VKSSATPRRRKKSAVARLRPFRVLIAAFVLALVAALGAAAVWPGFAPKSVEIRGNRKVARDEILARAAIADNVNIWLQDPHAIETRVEAIPYVATADVRRVPPATIAIDVTERVPFAIAAVGPRRWLVDRELRVLEPAGAAAVAVTLALPGGAAAVPGAFLSGPEALGLRSVYDELDAAHVAVVRVEYDRFGGAVATMPDGIKLLLGDDADMPKKIALIDPILAQVVRKGRPADAIDLRAPNTPVVVYKS
jgi:cell division protein FtsQ